MRGDQGLIAAMTAGSGIVLPRPGLNLVEGLCCGGYGTAGGHLDRRCRVALAECSHFREKCFMLAREEGVDVMRRGDRSRMHMLMLLGLVAALSLAGCGRKADLDPPSASATPAPTANNDPRSWGQSQPQNAPAPPPQPRKRTFVLDPLLN